MSAVVRVVLWNRGCSSSQAGELHLPEWECGQGRLCGGCIAVLLAGERWCWDTRRWSCAGEAPGTSLCTQPTSCTALSTTSEVSAGGLSGLFVGSPKALAWLCHCSLVLSVPGSEELCCRLFLLDEFREQPATASCISCPRSTGTRCCSAPRLHLAHRTGVAVWRSVRVAALLCPWQ